jgi:hypothetical protein
VSIRRSGPAAGSQRPGHLDPLDAEGRDVDAARDANVGGEILCGSTKMSRLGKKPIPAPKGVDITVEGPEVSVKGPKGTLNFRAH